uniref:NB-ARC domain-containing protein n=1 Tax=Mycena chlorophos TaxID=658473 RepID=A0ABQ0L718_MYCCL|nr:predicted protein [Mycena chlorophos]
MATSTRTEKLLNYVGSAVSVLNQLSSSSNVPYLKPIVAVVAFILDTLRNMKTHSEASGALLVQLHEILCALVELSTSNSGMDFDGLPPSVVEALGNFSETLQKIATVLRAQQGQGRIRRLLKASETATLLGECKTSLAGILKTFALELQLNFVQETGHLKDNAEERHRQLQELLAVEQDSSSLSKDMSIRGASSTSLLSLLPAAPKIFHGRDTELGHLVNSLATEFVRVAILGAGGMGKTTLALAALHHEDVAVKYPRRYFVSCDVANTIQTLVVVIARNMGLEEVKQPRQAILRHLRQGPSTLLVLDNLETSWEVPEARNDVEDLLSKLSELPHLSLVVTMRGAERPSKVLWSRPHIPPLSLLSESASRDVWMDIADNPDSAEDAAYLDQILGISDNYPLALHLLANTVVVEGYAGTLDRWDAEQTQVISDGYDKRTSLEISLQLSLSSPRLVAMDGAVHLLSLLSLLPDGLSDAELVQNVVSTIPNPRACRTILLQTALAYLDRGRLKVLAPVRSYISATVPPPHDIIRPFRRYYCSLLFLWRDPGVQPDDQLDRRLLGVVGNISAVVTSGLDAIEREEVETDSDIRQTLHGAIHLDSFVEVLLHAHYKPWYRVGRYIERLGKDTHLQVAYVSHLIFRNGATLTPEEIDKLLPDIPLSSAEVHDVEDQAHIKLQLAVYHLRYTGKFQEAMQYGREALVLAKETRNAAQQMRACHQLMSLTMIAGRQRDNLALLREMESLVNHTGQLKLAASLMQAKACVYIDLGFFGLALVLCSEAKQLYAVCEIENSFYADKMLDIVADAHYYKSEYNDARALHVELARRTSPDRSPLYYATANANIALIDILTDASEESILSHLVVARDLFARHRFLEGLRLCDVRMADLQLRRGDRQTARGLYLDLLAIPELDNTKRLWCISKLASPDLRLDETAPPFRWPAVYLAQGRKIENVLRLADAARCFGDVFLAENDVGTAAKLFELALEDFTRMDVHRERAVCLSRLAAIQRDLGDIATARDCWEQAKALYERSLQMKQVEMVDILLKSCVEL